MIFKTIWNNYFVDKENKVLFYLIKKYNDYTNKKEQIDDGDIDSLCNIINDKVNSLGNLEFNFDAIDDLEYVEAIGMLLDESIKDIVIDYKLFIDGDIKMRTNLEKIGAIENNSYTQPVNAEDNVLLEGQINNKMVQLNRERSILGYARVYEKFYAIEYFINNLKNILITIL